MIPTEKPTGWVMDDARCCCCCCTYEYIKLSGSVAP